MFKKIRKTIALIKTYINSRLLYRYQHNAFLLTFRDDLLEWKPEIVHCNDWQTLSLGQTIKAQLNSKLIFDSHELETHRNPPLPESRKRWMEHYEAKYLANCDFVTTVCNPISNYLSRRYNISEPLVIYNSPILDTKRDAPEEWGRIAENTDVRLETKLDVTDFLLVSVGNATVNRGIENIFEVLPKMPNDVHLAIVGKVIPSFKKELESLIDKLNIKTRVHFIKPVGPTWVVDFIRTADVGLVSLIPMTLSYEFALPNKLFECAYAGLPIIASNTYEVEKKVKKYNLGHTYEAGNVDDLHKTLLKIYDERKTLKVKTKPNKAFMDKHDFEQSVGHLLKQLESNSD